MKEEGKSKLFATETLMDTSSVLKIRLDVTKIIEQIWIFLTGNKQIVVFDEKGQPYVHIDRIAKPKANDEGIQWILNYIQSIINAQAVQGNMTFPQYQLYIDEVHDGLLYNIMNNLHKWGIDEDDYEPICDEIMNLVQPFITRLIDNKERESYAQSLRVQETSSLTGSRGLFK